MRSNIFTHSFNKWAFLLLTVTILFSFIPNALRGDDSTVNDTIAVIPRPVSVEVKDGQFVLVSETSIYVDQGNSQVKGVGQYLSERLSPPTGLAMVVRELSDDAIVSGSIVLTLKNGDSGLGDEGYELTVRDAGVVVRAYQPAGLFRGVQTIRQLLPVEIESRTKVPGKVWAMPYVAIRDIPRFSWRGSMLDSCRHFLTKDFVKRYIDLMAYHKLNRLHWHLCEDQCWAIEIKKYPKLTQHGAYRSSGPNRYGGYYSQDDIREIVAYAADRYIMVIPEIEMPGHCQAALACYPELSCTGGPFKVSPYLAIHKDVYCAGNDNVFTFLEGVLDEVIELFPSPYIHIGGDECPKDRWKACEKCQKRIRAEGLADEHELQSYFIKRMERYLNSKGKRIIGWGEILEGGLAEGAVVQSWRDPASAITAVKTGHDVVMSPTSHCYIDYPNSRTPMKKVYSFEPIPEGLTGKQARHILGAEATMWTDRCCQEMVDSFAYPRVCALSEVLWSAKSERNWDNFCSRMDVHYKRLDQLGVTYTRPVPVVRVGEWKSEKGIPEDGVLRWDITELINALGDIDTLYVICQYVDGDCVVGLKETKLTAGAKEISCDQQESVIGWPNPLERYELKLPQEIGEQLELEIRVSAEPNSRTRCRIWISSDRNPSDVF